MDDFCKKPEKTGPTHVGARIQNFFQDFFRESEIGHFFCPFFEKSDSPDPKNNSPLLKKILASQTKNIFLNLLR
jgi:hypothetical protein